MNENLTFDLDFLDSLMELHKNDKPYKGFNTNSGDEVIFCKEF